VYINIHEGARLTNHITPGISGMKVR